MGLYFGDFGISGFRTYLRSSFFALLAAVTGCGKDEFPDPGPPRPPDAIGSAQVWLTTGDQVKLLSAEEDVDITAVTGASLSSVTLDPAQKFQEVEGFGAALTGSSAYLINRVLSPAQRALLLEELFDPTSGIGISYLRMTIGASDFSLSDYTYDDMPSGETDFPLEHFSISPDKADVVPVLRQIVSAYPGVKVMGSPWSAPAWMKTTGTLRGGKLRPEAYDAYARYLVKYIHAFRGEGIAIDAITPQNEPLHSTSSYPSMEMQAEEQKTFIRDHLGPAFAAEGLQTGIIIYDHNWDNVAYPIAILDDPSTSHYVEGSAFHGYGGNVSAMGVLHDAHPGKGLYFTEISGGSWATDFGDNLQWNMANIFIGTMKNWSKTALLWNLALDEQHGPTNNGCQDCRGVVTINTSDGSVARNVEYYATAHFSKFVRPGAFRIRSTSFESSSNLDHVAFQNADGSVVVVVSNSGTGVKPFAVIMADRQLTYSLPARSVVTLVWK